MQQLLLATARPGPARLHVVQDKAALETCLSNTYASIYVCMYTCMYMYAHMYACTYVHAPTGFHTAAHYAYVQVHLVRLRVCEIEFRIWIQSSACQYDPRK